MSSRVIAAVAGALLACGTSESPSDAGSDATVTDVSNDTGAHDANDGGVDAPVDGPTETSCSVPLGTGPSCQLEAGTICFDYAGSGWADAGPVGCSADAGAYVVWDAGCPSTNRTGSCVIGAGGFEFVERCYPPFTTTQCLGLCLVVNADGGFCPN